MASSPKLRSLNDPSRSIRSAWSLVLALAVCLVSGCYDGTALLKNAQSAALNTTLAEVDLGEFRTTLPRDPSTGTFTTLEMHIFGTVPQARLAAVERQLKNDEYRLRHETLTAVRQSSSEDLGDPSLSKIRTRIEEVVNKVLADAPVEGIGFYQLTLR